MLNKMKLSKLFMPTKLRIALFIVIFAILWVVLMWPFTIPAKVLCIQNPCPQEITTNLMYQVFPQLIESGLWLGLIIFLVISYLISCLATYKRYTK